MFNFISNNSPLLFILKMTIPTQLLIKQQLHHPRSQPMGDSWKGIKIKTQIKSRNLCRENTNFSKKTLTFGSQEETTSNVHK